MACYLDIEVPAIATSRLQLVTEAEQASLSLTRSKPQKTWFIARRLKWVKSFVNTLMIQKLWNENKVLDTQKHCEI